MIKIATYCLFLVPLFGWGQLTVDISLKCENQAIGLNTPVQSDAYSFQLEQARFYLSKFEFYHNGQLTFRDPVPAYLVDFEIDSTRKLVFPGIAAFEVDEIRFLFGIDSATNTSGAMAGALDPMHGMYWSWQSGYINCKLEGTFLTPEKEAFQLHLGGYAHPFFGAQQIVLKTDSGKTPQITIDLNFLLERVISGKTERQVMSPGSRAVEYARLLAKSIDLKR
ncbi:MbnP family protein [Fluviicola sp.]|uniref:MbnP family protein n=1 Tax=Fluviicola sp. TaxID=1917219 RepID=UPI0031DAB654